MENKEKKQQGLHRKVDSIFRAYDFKEVGHERAVDTVVGLVNRSRTQARQQGYEAGRADATKEAITKLSKFSWGHYDPISALSNDPTGDSV